MIPLLFCAIVVLIALSAFFSASEMVCSSANRMRLENAVENRVRGASLALHIYDHFDNTLSAVLVGNNLVNIATSSIGSVIAVSLWGENWTWVMTVVLTLAVIIFGETMPKIVAKKNANKLVLLLCYPVRFLTLALKPVTVVVVGLVNLIMKLLPKPNVVRSEDEAQQELASIIETAEDENVLDEEQTELLQAALAFNDTSIQEVMTARVDIESIDIDDPIEEILAAAERSSFARLPVYEDTIDNIIGILTQDKLCRLLSVGECTDIRPLLSEPVYLYKTTKLPHAIELLRDAHQRIGIIVDEYGGTLGIVTIEDMMEELVGEIWDEDDIVEEEEVIEHSDGLYELDGDVQISELAELMDWDEDEVEIESSTVGGMTTELSGTFPDVGDVVTYRDAEIKVLSMDGLRVDRVLVTQTESDEDEDEDEE